MNLFFRKHNKSIATDLEKIFKALGNLTRLYIVRAVLLNNEISCQELMEKFSLSQPTMSHHFGILLDSDILLARKNGTRHFYKINTEKLHTLGINLIKLTE